MQREHRTDSGHQEESKNSSHSRKGLASADKETRQRVASEGGKASHGGGRHRHGHKGSHSKGREFPLL